MPAKKRTARKKVVRPEFKAALTSLTLLGSLWRTAVAFAVMITLMVAGLARQVYAAMTYAGDASLTAAFGDGFVLSAAFIELVVFLAAFFVYDSVYVGTVRRYRMNETADTALLLSLEAAFFTVWLVISAISAVGYGLYDWRAVMAFQHTVSMAIPLLILGAVSAIALRALIGVSWVMARVKVRR